jgi:hypothetical protein
LVSLVDEVLPVLGEGVFDVREGEAHLFGFDNEFFEFGFEKARAFGGGGGTGRGDGGDGADADFEQALGHELGDYFLRGVGVDFEIFAEGADGGEWFAGAELAGDHGAFDGIDDLFEE